MQIDGVCDHIAFNVNEGQTVLDPNSANGGALLVTNNQTQTDGELVCIEGTVDQTALKVYQGQTVLDPNSANGGALLITNTNATQTTGHLVNITGTPGQTALHVDEGNTQLGPVTVTANDASGQGLVISNTATQTSGHLVSIAGQNDYTALHVSAGNVLFAKHLEADSATFTNGLDSTAIGTNTPASGAFTTLIINTSSTIPANSNDTAGNTGEIRIDGNYMYMYTGTQWVRSEFQTF